MFLTSWSPPERADQQLLVFSSFPGANHRGFFLATPWNIPRGSGHPSRRILLAFCSHVTSEHFGPQLPWMHFLSRTFLTCILRCRTVLSRRRVARPSSTTSTSGQDDSGVQGRASLSECRHDTAISPLPALANFPSFSSQPHQALRSRPAFNAGGATSRSTALWRRRANVESSAPVPRFAERCRCARSSVLSGLKRFDLAIQQRTD